MRLEQAVDALVAAAVKRIPELRGSAPPRVGRLRNLGGALAANHAQPPAGGDARRRPSRRESKSIASSLPAMYTPTR
jgi:hypothetical protein